MRISDWSSDVCSSDLEFCEDVRARRLGGSITRDRRDRASGAARPSGPTAAPAPNPSRSRSLAAAGDAGAVRRRSEEHTSELQSLMRISYAVFCLKKTKKKDIDRHTQPHYTCNYTLLQPS